MEIGFIGFAVGLGVLELLSNTKPMQKIFEKLLKAIERS